MANNNTNDVPYAVASGNRTALIILGILAGLMTLTAIAFATAWAKEYSRKEKTPEPIIYEVDKTAHKIVRVEKGDLGQTKESLLRSVAFRDYVQWRETINHIDEKDRWKKVKLMSNNSVYKNFFNLMNPKVNPNSVFANKKFTRRIEIINDYPISTNVHRVEFYSTDTIDGEVYPTQRFVAVFKYSTSEAYVSYEDRFINISGVKVINYQIREA